MRNVVVCTHCGMKLGIPDIAAGQLVQCPGCATVFSGRTDSTDDDDDRYERAGDARGEANFRLLPWSLITFVVLVVSGAGGFMTWHFTHDQVAQEEKLVLDFDKHNPTSDPEDIAVGDVPVIPPKQNASEQPNPGAPQKKSPK